MIMSKIYFIKMMISVLLISFFHLSFALSADEVIVETTQEVLERIELDKEKLQVSPEYIKDIVHELVVPNMDFLTMSALSLGKNWQILSKDVHACVSKGFKNLLVERYAYVLLSYRKQDISYGDVKNIGKKGYVALIQTLSRPETKSSTLEYRMRPVDDSWRVVDLLVDGVSLVKSYHKMFKKDIKEKGLTNFIYSFQECNS